MCEFNPKNDGRRIDPCMKPCLTLLSVFLNGAKVVACCCSHGHKDYPKTIVIETIGKYKNHFELFSGVKIPRKKKFYKKDKQGFYYIPETLGDY